MSSVFFFFFRCDFQSWAGRPHVLCFFTGVIEEQGGWGIAQRQDTPRKRHLWGTGSYVSGLKRASGLCVLRQKVSETCGLLCAVFGSAQCHRFLQGFVVAGGLSRRQTGGDRSPGHSSISHCTSQAAQQRSFGCSFYFGAEGEGGRDTGNICDANLNSGLPISKSRRLSSYPRQQGKAGRATVHRIARVDANRNLPRHLRLFRGKVGAFFAPGRKAV